ncbi:MAG: N-6 DNA methylase [Bacteroidetes bacterium]|nr:N-6 DNA methylase [Bacteroidota bacterium]
MLDSITKKRIDNCRDILVGKVPDPKSQIEQITIALIYKFMDDMDREAVELGGKRQFFGKEYEKYAWPELFKKELSGENRVKLYAEAIDKMDENPGIPQLFRDIFKNAYLPYRDPETLREFLKYINEFTYDHSEKLGDAFEYLLSVLGSQGDAGQFRTPRHIIDFIVELLAPQKNEVILDPACGTAGFLISAYKYILKNNSANFDAATDAPAFMQHYGKEEGKRYKGDKLTPDQRKKLANNLNGYDISPDMVRLSLVNLYLHGLPEPHIYEYDTLTSEDRWNEKADVILANPPFMSPKGGIRPHKKFGVQANKAEVLFTDYIAEHLNSNGRAGIVVPNGIVATSQTAYKQLRQLLVQDSLIAVISLPAGVFQPYSGVKTSILILDKHLAKKSQHILFLKIENDGFDLGAQRRQIDKNDLPVALQTIKAYKECLSNDKVFEDLPGLATLVEKEVVLGNKDVVLSAERYFEAKETQTEFELVKIGDAVKVNANAIDPLKAFKDEPFVYIDIEAVENGTGKVSYNKILNPKDAPSRARRIVKNGDVIVSTVRPNLKAFAYLENVPKNCLASTGFAVLSENERVLGKYIYYIITQDIIVEQMISMSDKGQYPSITASDLAEIEIPIPPLEIQQQIVAEIEGYQKIIDGAKQVVNNYKPTININPDWETVELGKLANLVGGSTPSKDNSSYWENGNIDWITCSDFSNSPMYIEDSIRKITEKAVKDNSTNIIPKDTLVLVTRVSLGKMAFVRKPTALNQDLTALLFDEDKINKRYGYFFMLSIADKIENDGHGATVKGVTRNYVRDIKVPLPSLEKQLTIVKAIEEELQLVNANKRLIEIFEQKIKDSIDKVWGKEKTQIKPYTEIEMPLRMVAEAY